MATMKNKVIWQEGLFALPQRLPRSRTQMPQRGIRFPGSQAAFRALLPLYPPFPKK